MRTTIVASLVTFLMSVGLAVNAEATENPISLAVFGGMATPTGDLAEYWNSGFSLGGSINYRTNEFMALEFVAAGDQRFGFDDVGLLTSIGLDPDAASIDGISVNVFSLTGGLRLGANDRDVFPYAAMGAGFYRIGVSDAVITIPGVGTQTLTGVSENALGVNFGGGIQTRVSPAMSFFGEMRYHIAMTEGASTKFLPIHAGMQFNW